MDTLVIQETRGFIGSKFLIRYMQEGKHTKIANVRASKR